jgi:hypothetical protein
MPPDRTAAHSDDRCRHCRTQAVSGEPHGNYARAVRISRWRRTNPSLPMHASHHSESVQPYDSSRTLASKISMLHVVAEGVGS